MFFFGIIDNQFRAELKALDSGQQNARRNELFENLRSSATLTRSEDKTNYGWVFSHNSLREYLVTEFYIASIKSEKFVEIAIPISAPMRTFVASMPKVDIQRCVELLAAEWPLRIIKRFLGRYLTLLWDGFGRLSASGSPEIDLILKRIGGGAVSIDSVTVNDVELSKDNMSNSHLKLIGRDSEFSEVSFKQLNLSGSKFAGSFLDSVSFIKCDLQDTDFDGSLIFECDFTYVNIKGASFKGLLEEPIIFVQVGEVRTRLSGNYALGYLKFNGGKVEPLDDYFVY